MQAAGAEKTYGDLLFYIFGGMEEYIIDSGNPFHYPELWILITLFISYRILYYPYKDLMGVGINLLFCYENQYFPGSFRLYVSVLWCPCRGRNAASAGRAIISSATVSNDFCKPGAAISFINFSAAV